MREKGQYTRTPIIESEELPELGDILHHGRLQWQHGLQTLIARHGETFAGNMLVNKDGLQVRVELR